MKYVDPRNPGSVVLIVALAIFACSLPALLAPSSPVAPTSPPPPIQGAAPSVPASEPSLNPTTRATTLPAITVQPTFEPAACEFPVPRGYNPECGYLIVPENRARPDSRLIRLHVGIFRNRAGTQNSNPVLKISGGPGSSGLNTAGYLLEKGMDAVLDQRDFIVFDQRGTGYSRPRLDCPERIEIASAVLGGRLTAEETSRAVIDSFRRCRERLIAEGVDLSAYNSASSAADINDLRMVLGYEQLNLYAISYGTRLALTLMRDYPKAVRSAVLDSTYPLEVNLYTSLAPNAERAFHVFFDRCAADPGCNSSYPDLRTVFYTLLRVSDYEKWKNWTFLDHPQFFTFGTNSTPYLTGTKNTFTTKGPWKVDPMHYLDGKHIPVPILSEAGHVFVEPNRVRLLNPWEQTPSPYVG